MKFSIQHVKCHRSIFNKVVIALIFTSAISVCSISSALADRDHGPGRGHQHGGYGNRGWHDGRDGYRYRPGFRQPYLYAQPVYIPPPVYYPPQQSPGISLFFPLNIRHR